MRRQRGRAARPRGVEVADVDRARLHQVAAAAGARTRSGRRRPGCRRARARRACRGGRSCQRHGSSNQRMSRSSTRRAEVERLARACSPGSRRSSSTKSVARRLARGARRARRPRAGVAPPTLNLQPREAQLAPLRDLVARSPPSAAVVAADRCRSGRVAVAAPEPPERLAERLADRVPDRRGRRRAARRGRCRRSRRMSKVTRAARAASSARPRTRPRRSAAASISSRTTATISASAASSSPAYASPTMPSRVWTRVITVAPVRHAVVAAREHAGERYAKGHDLDPLDREGIQARLADHAPRGLLEAHRTAAPR